MKVVVVLSSLYTGGAEFSTLSFYGWLIKRGYTVKLVCVKRANPSYDPLQFGFQEVAYLADGSYIKRIKSLKKIVKAFRPQLVHSVLFEANLVSRFVRMTDNHFVHLESLVNEMYSDYRLADPRVTKLKLEGYRWLDKITQRWGVDHFHANGNSVAGHYKQKLGIDEKRITIVPRGRLANPFVGDETNRRKVRQELHTSNNRLIILHAGRHEFQKGQDVLLDAINRMRDHQVSMQVVLVGRDGNYSSVIKEKIKSYHLDQCVVITGHRNDLSSLLAASNIFVFPSRFEGLPGVLIEAEAAGLPIICSDIPNNHEVAEENRNALFFNVDDAEGLSQKLLTFMKDASLRDRMGRESLAIYRQNFDLEEVHQRMLALIEKITTAS